ncbi:hypothetical protein [Cryobacterium psychrophilum]|uniref:Uncharacterized protein n=1 Tax=Cryobacterium psychrophilum TaxID=41988 RepID=A0A4Y8KNZ7_9MICO|nr:hypothetical protein [Cryobacterium psychrophilum]TDW30748.1 hypothetical protein EDD25_2521 [Cryobacterium psychrophilum]TFD75848.1 hypothetical protein E3T53_15405 [Cryobacterium psychrophilum]
MRWDNLFDDLEGQLERELTAEESDLRAEEERHRLGRLTLRSRLMVLSLGPAGPAAIRVVLATGNTVVVRATTFGRDWFAADLFTADLSDVERPTGLHADRARRTAQCVVPLASIAGLALTADQVDRSLGPEIESPSAARLSDRIGLSFVLRDLCRRRAGIELHTRTGLLTGTIDRVGRDHLDLAVHPPGTLRRTPAVEHYRVVPLEQVAFIKLT